MPPRTRAKATPAKAKKEEEVKEEKVEEEEPEAVEEPEADEEAKEEEEEEEKDEAEEVEENAENGDEDEKADEKADDEEENKEGDEGSQDKADGEKEGETKEKAEEEKKVKIPIELDEKAKTWVVVVVGQVTYADFGLTELKLPLLKCNSFETRFFQEDDTKKGYVTMFFSKSWDAYVAVDKLRELEVPREGDKTTNYCCWLLDKTQTHTLMRQEESTLKQLRTDLDATNDLDPSLRSLFVANIPKSATKDLLTAIFAEAQDIVLPLAEPGKNKGYCYIEFSEGGEKLDEYLTKYQDIKIEDGEVSAKIIIRKIGNSVTDKGKERASRMLKARSKQQIADLGKKSSVDSRKPRDGGKGNYRGSPYRGGSRFPRNERYDSRSRNYGNQYYGGRGGGPRDDRRDTGAAALAAIQQLLAKPMGMNRGRGRGGSGGGGGSSGGGGGSGSSGGFRRGGTKRRFPGGFDDYGGDYGMAKVARRYDGPMDMGGHSSHFYEDQYDSGWGGSSFSQGYGGGGGGSGGYMGGGGGGGGYGGGGGGGGMNDRRRKNFRGGKFNKR